MGIKNTLPVATAIACLFLFAAKPASAIIFLPVVVLVPIAKILAFVLAGFSVPLLGLGALWSRIYRISTKKTAAVLAVSMLIAALLIGLFLKLKNPERPWL